MHMTGVGQAWGDTTHLEVRHGAGGQPRRECQGRIVWSRPSGSPSVDGADYFFDWKILLRAPSSAVSPPRACLAGRPGPVACRDDFACLELKPKSMPASAAAETPILG